MAKVIEKVGQAEAEKEELISGSEAIAVACKLAAGDVITAYPIRPYDTVMQYVAKLVSNGEMDCEYIVAESEHSQFEIVKHASAAGARVFCGSSGVGWMYAFEAITVTPALRIPMVAMVGNRALDDPGAFGVEHNDALAVRDLGWMLVWVDNAQEALDVALIAYRVAEDRRVFLPCAIACDGAFLTHSQSIVKVPPQSWVNEFLPPYDRGDLLLHPDNPITVAPQVNEDWLMELRKHNDEAMKRAQTVIREAYADHERIFGRASGAGPVQGRGRHRPRLLLRLPVLQRGAGERDPRRALQRAGPAAAALLHLRAGWARGDRAQRAGDDRPGPPRGRGREARDDAVDRHPAVRGGYYHGRRHRHPADAAA